MNLPHKISIADDFSTVPLGRFPDDSPFNGTTFREIWLIPALAKYQSIEVDLDRAEGYGSSFLEEAFGGLVRLHSFTAGELLRRISFISKEDPTLIEEIRQYIDEATAQEEKNKNEPREN
jgi:hypothetical protein